METMMSSVELGGFALRWASRTDVGKVRMINEDSTLAVPGMFVVADGMGGHAAGDIASSLTIESFRAASESMPMPITQLSIVLSAANESVITYARDNDRDGMGTTVVGAAVVDNGGDPAIVVFHVGDSRCYLVGTDRLVRLTKDHSLVQEMVDHGEITEDEAAYHPHRNVVTRAVGIDAVVTADFLVLPEAGQQRFLLCSDGVSGELDDVELHRLLAQNPDPAIAVSAIIDAVLSGRARDNASAIVIDIRMTSLSPRPDVDVTGPRVPRTEEASMAHEALIAEVPVSSRPSAATRLEAGGSLIDEVPS